MPNRAVSLAAVVLGAALGSSRAAEPNPPVWPASVKVFGPEDSSADVEAAVNAAFAKNGGHSPDDHGQFSKERFAFLFKPGDYDVEVPVGYYTHVAGLGSSPEDVVFTSEKGVYCEEGSFTVSPGALDTFWRAAENFRTKATFNWNNRAPSMLWAASQAAPLRRIVVDNALQLYQHTGQSHAAGFSSGGFIANVRVGANVMSGSQQQFLARNCEVGGWEDGVWNMVFVGTKGAPSSHCGVVQEFCTHPYTTVDTTPVIAEKPFIAIDSTGKYTLNIPGVMRNRQGADFGHATAVGFEHVYVADAGKDTASTINAKLAGGLHVVLSAGIYNLDAALELNTENQVLLGIGLATLVATNGNAAVKVGNVDGVRVAGVLLEAGPVSSNALLEWGDSLSKYAGNSQNPGFLHDVNARVGGPATPAIAQAKYMIQINSGNVVGDNMWLWRADHTETGIVKAGTNPCDVAMQVQGDDVTMYSLATEHTLQDLVQWNGERGSTFFFQAEMPYDVTQENYGDMGYTGYRVGSAVTEHKAYGVGVYHFFRDNAVSVQSGIVAPAHLEASFVAPFAVFLNGLGTVQHIINDKGNYTTKLAGSTNANPQWLCPSSAPQSWASAGATCKVGDPVKCPGTSLGCAGSACCPDGSACPSADDRFMCCPKPKEEDCTNGTAPSPSPGPAPAPGPVPPAPSAQCKVGDNVVCPGTSTARCAGSQCCPDGTTCPSAAPDFQGCAGKKKVDCTAPAHFDASEIFVV